MPRNIHRVFFSKRGRVAPQGGFVHLFNHCHRVAVRIGHGVLVREVAAFRSKIGVLSGNGGRLIVNYWNRGRSHIRTFVPVGVPRLHAVFDRVPACRNGFRKGAGGCCRCLCIAPVVYRPFQNIGDRVAVRIGGSSPCHGYVLRAVTAFRHGNSVRCTRCGVPLEFIVSAAVFVIRYQNIRFQITKRTHAPAAAVRDVVAQRARRVDIAHIVRVAGMRRAKPPIPRLRSCRIARIVAFINGRLRTIGKAACVVAEQGQL